MKMCAPGHTVLIETLASAGCVLGVADSLVFGVSLSVFSAGPMPATASSSGYTPVCEECRTAQHVLADYRSGRWVCTHCGLQCGGQIVAEGSEWRSFDDDKGGADPSRVGGPSDVLLGDLDLHTTISAVRGADDETGALERAHRQTVMTADGTFGGGGVRFVPDA
ncbi:MAG: hypothetical protein MHM6MM_007790 [Cercozoa sp. M6MM]